jgi:cysteine desulfurase
VGSLQPLERIAARCRAAGVILHVDAVQVVGHRPLQFHQLPIDLLSFTAHKLQGPRGIGALLVRRGIGIVPLVGGGAQERGRRGGTEPVALAAGMARALELCADRLEANGGEDPLKDLRDQLLERLLSLPGLRLSGPDPRVGGNRLPHHISLLVSDRLGRPMAGRDLVRALWQEGVAASSGSACSSSRAASPVLLAMGCTEQRASSGIRLSLGPWLSAEELERVAPALDRAREQVQA